MSGIVFLGTRHLNKIVGFYEMEIGAGVWLRQADCVILEHGNMLFGLCQREHCDIGGILTFFYPTQGDVDARYRQFRDQAVAATKINEKYGIYTFFAMDPEGRSIEFQHFLDLVNLLFLKVLI